MSHLKLRPAPTQDGWVSCGRCQSLLYGKRLARNLRVCPDCGHHMLVTATDRLEQLLDPGSHVPLPLGPSQSDPLGFADVRPYADRLRDARASTGLDDAVICARGEIDGMPVVAAVMDFRFMAGSLGIAAGEQITRAAETARADRCALLVVNASGGARMQEGILSLMQLAKTSQALAELDEAGILTLSLITDPTYGGVAASFATLADVIIAEPGARMGFAGPRVIEQTIRQALPEGFQTAEYLLERGLIDDVQPRSSLRARLGALLRVMPRVPHSRQRAGAGGLIRQPELLPERPSWEVVRLARHTGRPTAHDYVIRLLDGFTELHGDRASGDCPAIIGGIGMLAGEPVMAIGHQKAHTTSGMISRNYGMATPAGYRKSARLMRLAAKLGLPVITFVDTPGAYPGVQAEERGQAAAIAENLRLMSGLPVPVVAVVTGEGGSGGALALAVADRVLCCANSFYSVISPEGCAAILWRSAGAAAQAAAALRLAARDLLALKVVDAVIPEPDGGAHRDLDAAADMVRDALITTVDELSGLSPQQLVRQRRHRFRRYGAGDVLVPQGVPA